MKNWSVYLLIVLALPFASMSNADDDEDEDDYYAMEDINPDQIVFNISNTSHGINVTWSIPHPQQNPQCYLTEVQYKSQCVKDWKRGQRIEVKQEHYVYNLNLSTLSIKMNYDFRIRMKLWCVNKNWSNWTKVQSWGNNKGACMVESSASIWVYILIIVLPLTGLLLVYLLTQQGIRRLILPKVPDLKHFKNEIMDIDHSQCWGNLPQLNEECTTTDIEIIDKNETEEQHQTLVIQPIDTSAEQHDNMYCIYSSETSGENTEPQYSQMVLGYITL
ncbi:cytokine receptor-like factor 2 isoform X2 [Pimephales promelas]|uniref:cytokine receptor-like factor 2 isoform X2 n=1 Tax=Pimephales promelas TaxID=90988 RepID=UPI001955A2AF|nr:cytokine receptor-like factor 2 isoform X2 [Pimephales promelas]KAG1968614.1 cytokine receptor-like factor [Pimephales promelas]